MNEIIRKSEKPPVFGLLHQLDDVFDDFFRPLRDSGPLSGGTFSPALDVVENENAYEIRADLPGVKKEDLEITIQDGVLAINAETRTEDVKKQGDRVIRQERHFGKLVRSMRVGNSIDVENIQADLKDGVLNLVLPKAERVKPKRIDVTVS